MMRYIYIISTQNLGVCVCVCVCVAENLYLLYQFQYWNYWKIDCQIREIWEMFSRKIFKSLYRYIMR